MDRTIVFKTRPMLVIEQRLGRSLEAYFEERYTRDGLTLREVGEELGVDYSTVSRWMRQLGIEARFPGPQRKVAV